MATAFLSLSLAAVLCLSACGGGGDRSEKAAGSEAAGSSAESGGGTATTIHLVITGGQHAGTYDAKSSDVTCSHGIAGENAWGNQYSVTGKKPSEFSSLQLIVPDAKDAADGTDRFLLTAAFGELLQQGFKSYTIDRQREGSERGGSGTVTVDDKGKSGKVTFKGKTADGVSLEGTIECHQVMRV